MISDKLGAQLHDRWTRGETLTEVELAELTTWYAIQDEAEEKYLNPNVSEFDLEKLQAQIDETVAELTVLTRRVQEKTAENSALRQDIFDLSQQLAKQKQPV